MRNIKKAIKTTFYVHADPISFPKMVRVRIKSMPKSERENTSMEINLLNLFLFTHEVKSEKAKFILRIIRKKGRTWVVCEVFWLMIENLLLVDYDKIKPCDWPILVTWPVYWPLIGRFVPCLMRSSLCVITCVCPCQSMVSWYLAILARCGWKLSWPRGPFCGSLVFGNECWARGPSHKCWNGSKTLWIYTLLYTTASN